MPGGSGGVARSMISILITVFAILILAVLALAIWSYAAQRRVAERWTREGQPVEVGEGSLNVVDLGPRGGDGVPIVMIHGSGSNLLDLKVSLGDRLARDNRVILIDRPGHGWSDRLGRDGVDTPEGQAVALHDILLELGVARPLIVGHGSGAAIALSYALSYPENVGGIAAIAPLSHPWPSGVSRLYRVVGTPVIGWVVSALLAPTLGQIVLSRNLRKGFAPQPVPGDYSEAVAATLLLRPKNFRADAEDAVGFDSYLADQATYYGQISVPLVVIAGDKDRVIPHASQADALAGEVPGARLVVLADVGHMAHHVSPNVIVFEIKRLVERMAPRQVRNLSPGEPPTDLPVQ